MYLSLKWTEAKRRRTMEWRSSMWKAERWGERSWCLTSLFCGIRLWRSSSLSDDESLHSASEIRIEFSASWIQKEKRK
jgi:hypothetical protein